MSQTDKRLLLLNPDDNVLLLSQHIEAGESIQIADLRLEMKATLELGHKIARQPISAGENIVKYGLPIGYAREDIAVGAHVHVHNIASRYTAVNKPE